MTARDRQADAERKRQEWIRRVVVDAPPLTQAQRDQLAALLRRCPRHAGHAGTGRFARTDARACIMSLSVREGWAMRSHAGRYPGEMPEARCR